MATRADFYIKTPQNIVSAYIWIGSISYDGNPEHIPTEILEASSPYEFYKKIKKEIEGRDDSFFGNELWPWAWESSNQTDFTYTFEKGNVTISKFGRGEIDIDTYQLCAGDSNIAWDTLPIIQFPKNMKDLKINSLKRYLKSSLENIKPASHPYDPYLTGG